MVDNTHTISDILNDKFDKNKMVVSDIPVDNDCFGSNMYYNNIVDIIRSSNNAQGAVIGITGPWGSGKTTVIHNISRILANEFVCIEFNMWIRPNPKFILADIYDAIVRKLGISSKKRVILIREKLLSYILEERNKTLFFISKIYGLNKDIVESIQDLINGELSRSGKKLLLVFDDIDRCDKSTIDVVLSATHGIYRLNNTSYIFCYDSDVMCKNEFDRLYLEKTTNIVVNVPIYSDKQYSKIITDVCKKLFDEETNTILQNLINCFSKIIKNPRELISLINIIIQSSKDCYQKNIVDTTIISYLNCKHNVIYQKLIENKDSFLKKYFWFGDYANHISFKGKMGGSVESIDVISGGDNNMLSLLHILTDDNEREYSFVDGRYQNTYFSHVLFTFHDIDLIVDDISNGGDFRKIINEITTKDYYRRYYFIKKLSESVKTIIDKRMEIITLLFDYAQAFVTANDNHSLPYLLFKILNEDVDEECINKFVVHIKQQPCKLRLISDVIYNKENCNKMVFDKLEGAIENMRSSIINEKIDLYSEKNYFPYSLWVLIKIGQNMPDDNIAEHIRSIISIDTNHFLLFVHDNCSISLDGNYYSVDPVIEKWINKDMLCKLFHNLDVTQIGDNDLFKSLYDAIGDYVKKITQ